MSSRITPESIKDIENKLKHLFHDEKVLRSIERIETGGLGVVIRTEPEQILNKPWGENSFIFQGKPKDETEIKLEKIQANLKEPIVVAEVHPISYLLLKSLAQSGQLGSITDIDILDI